MKGYRVSWVVLLSTSTDPDLSIWEDAKLCTSKTEAEELARQELHDNYPQAAISKVYTALDVIRERRRAGRSGRSS